MAGMTRRRHLPQVAAIAGVGLLAWCDALAAPARDTPGGGTGTATGRVEFWQAYQNSPTVPRVKELVERKCPRLQVEMVDVAQGQMAPKLTVAVAGGTPPDAIFVTSNFFRDCARFYRPLDRFLKRDGKQIDKDDFLPAGLKTATIKGQVYGLPLEVPVLAWWFNTDVFRERGVPSPVRAGAPTQVDYKAVEEMAQRLTFARGDKQVWGLFAYRRWSNVLQYVYGFGGQYLDADHTKCLLGSPQAVAGLQYPFDLIEQRRIALPTDTTSALLTYETENAVAMAYWNVARAQFHRRYEHGTFWDVGPVVKGPGGPLGLAAVHHAGVVADSKPNASWDLHGPGQRVQDGAAQAYPIVSAGSTLRLV